MTLGNFGNEAPQRMVDIGQRLTGRGFREKDHEIDRMTFVKGHADLGIMLETADPGTMTGARIDDDDRWLVEIDAIVPAILSNIGDAHQGVVLGMLEAARVEDRLVLEVEQGRQAHALMLQHVARALAQRIPEQDRALPGIDTVLPGRLHRRACDPFGRR